MSFSGDEKSWLLSTWMRYGFVPYSEMLGFCHVRLVVETVLVFGGETKSGPLKP